MLIVTKVIWKVIAFALIEEISDLIEKHEDEDLSNEHDDKHDSDNSD